MAGIEKFEDHCWRDVVPEADLKLYSSYARETFVGPSPALLAIDLYNLVYRGGPRSPYELEDQYPNSCGIYAHRAIEPTKKLSRPRKSNRLTLCVTAPHDRIPRRPIRGIRSKTLRPHICAPR